MEDAYGNRIDKRADPFGKFQKIEQWFDRQIDKCGGVLHNDDIIDLGIQYQGCEMDDNDIVAGQNGTGKSWTSIGLVKTYCRKVDKPFSISKSLMFGYQKPEEIEARIAESFREGLVLDEAQYFLNYLDFNSKQTKIVVKAIEKLRARENLMFICTRDARRIVNTIRNGKTVLVIHLIDRYVDTNVPFGIVLSGNHFFENEDKFMLERIANVNSFEHFYSVVEDLPTFKGYYVADEKPMSDEEIAEYKAFKEKQMLTPYYAKSIAHDLRKSNKKLDEKQQLL